MEKNYLKYRENFKKINLLQLILSIISLALVIGVILLPLFNASAAVKIGLSLEDFDYDYIAYMEAVKAFNESFKEYSVNFSLFSDVVEIVKALKSGSGYEFVEMIFPLFTLFTGIVISFFAVKNIISSISIVNSDKDEEIMLEYEKIKKSIDESNKKSMSFQQSNIYSFVLMLIMTVLFGKFVVGMFGGGALKFAYFSGFSSWIVVIGMLLIAYIVVDIIKKKEKKKVKIEITKEQYSTEKPENQSANG